LLTKQGEKVKLNDAEIKAYLSLREMFDNALERFKEESLRDFGVENLIGDKDAAAKLMKMSSEAKSNASQFKYQNIARFIREIEQAKRTGYVPLSRYGDYVVAVKERVFEPKFRKISENEILVKNVPEELTLDMQEIGASWDKKRDGWVFNPALREEVKRLSERTVYSTKVETSVKELLKERKADSLEDIPSVKKAIEYARNKYGGEGRRVVAFKSREIVGGEPVSMSGVDARAQVANLDPETWDEVREKLSSAIQGKSFRKHFFRSDNVPGYTGDFERSMADYVIGMGGYLSRRKHAKQ
jgi:hypothetical protein